MKRFMLVFPVYALLVFLLNAAQAHIPKLINYQGMLTDDIGDPITDTLDLDFRIYNAPSDGTLKWSETLTQVPVINGLFNVMLGTETDLELDFSEPYWLEVDVGGEIMSRLQFTSVGYAYRAERADTAQYAQVGGSGDSDWDVVGSILFTHGAWGIARDGNTLLGDFDYTHVNLGVSCTTGASGEDNRCCTVGGGLFNAASGQYATVGGGYENSADTSYATVGGGRKNTAGGYYATTGGGYDNSADISSATVGGGYNNSASGTFATVGGGWSNIASGDAATVGGGSHNSAIGNFSFAAGVRARANHHGTFVWADGLDIDFTSTGSNQFLIRASGGVGIGTNSPSEKLEVHSSQAGVRAFLELETSHVSQFEETGIRFRTPAHTWHLRMDDVSNDNLPDTGSLGLRSQVSGELMTWTKNGNVGIGTTSPEEKLHVKAVTEGVMKIGTPTSDGDAVIIFEEGNDDAMALRYDGSTNELRIDDETTDNTRMVIERSGNMGIGTTNPGSYKLAVNGNAAKSSGGTSWATFSDVRLKEIAGNYEYGLSQIGKLKPVRYRYKRDNELGLPTMQEQVGLVAQDVQKAIPDAVCENEQGYLMLNSDPIIWAMLNAIKELKAENEELKQRIEALEGQ